jgi:hypothetical protein
MNQPKYKLHESVEYMTTWTSTDGVTIDLTRPAIIVGVGYQPGNIGSDGVVYYDYNLCDKGKVFNRPEFLISVKEK